MSTGNGDDDFDSFNDGKTDNVVIDPLSDSANDDVAWHGLDLSDRGLYTVSPSISIYGHLTSLFPAPWGGGAWPYAVPGQFQ